MKYLVIMSILYLDRSYAKLIIRFSIVLDVYFEFKYQGHIHSKCRNYVAKNRWWNRCAGGLNFIAFYLNKNDVCLYVNSFEDCRVNNDFPYSCILPQAKKFNIHIRTFAFQTTTLSINNKNWNSFCRDCICIHNIM